MKNLNLLARLNSLAGFLLSQVKSPAKSDTEPSIAKNQKEISDLASLENVSSIDRSQANDDRPAAAPISGIANLLQVLGWAAIAGFICNHLNVPVAWLLGPLFLGIGFAFWQGRPRPLPKVCLTLGKAIIGVYSASQFSLDALILARDYAVPLLLCIAIVGGLSTLNGFLMWRLAGVDRLTGFLGTIPGSAAVIVALSEDLGADPLSVTVFQYARRILMGLVVPVMASWLLYAVGTEASGSLPSVATTNLEPASVYAVAIDLLFLAGCSGLGIVVGRWLRLPTSAFLGSFLLGIAVCWSFPDRFSVPPVAFAFALLLVGLSAGLKFDWQTIRRLWRAILLEVGLILMLIAGCLSVGYAFHLTTDVDVTTALLGFVPGAIELTIGTAAQLGVDTGTVVAIQMTRQLLILLALNILIIFLSSDRRSLHPRKHRERKAKRASNHGK